MTTAAEGLKGQGVIASISAPTTGTKQDGETWTRYSFKVGMADGKERTFSTFHAFGGDLRPGQRIAFVYSTKPGSYTDKSTGATKETTYYNMDAIVPPDEASPAPQNEREAAESWSDNKPKYEGWRIGQARNLAAVAIGQVDFKNIPEEQWGEGFKAWWTTLEALAQKIAPRLTDDFMAVQPIPDAPQAVSSPVAEQSGASLPEYIRNVTYSPEGDRVFSDSREFNMVVMNELGMNAAQARAILAVPNGELIKWDDPAVWRTLEAAYTDFQYEKKAEASEDLPW